VILNLIDLSTRAVTGQPVDGDHVAERPPTVNDRTSLRHPYPLVPVVLVCYILWQAS